MTISRISRSQPPKTIGRRPPTSGSACGAWDDAARDRTVHVVDINEDTIPADGKLMELAEDVASGKTSTSAALDQAHTLIKTGDSSHTASLK